MTMPQEKSQDDAEGRSPPVPATVDGPNGFAEDGGWNAEKYDLDDKWFPQPRRLTTADDSHVDIDVGVDTSGTNSPADTGVCTATDPITYRYLTFATELPSPSQLSSSAPEAPSLEKFRDPFTWSSGRKNVFVILSCLATGSAAYAAGSYVVAADQTTAEWHITEIKYFIGITLYTAGFGLAPMALAPFSEINGRRPVFLVTGYLFFVFTIVCASTPSFAGLLVARFLSGCMSSTFSTMVGGVLADIYNAADRNQPMTEYTGAVLFATGLGPLVSSPIGQHLNWRWIFWVQVIYIGMLAIALTFFFTETRGSVLLSRKAQALNKWYQAREDAGFYGFNVPISKDDGVFSPAEKIPHPAHESQRIRWKVKSDEDRTSIQRMIFTSVYRPFHLLVTEPVVFFFSIWISFSWAILYMMFDVIPYVFQSVYGFSLQQSGAVFTAIIVGSILATLLNIYQEKFAHRSKRLDMSTPEARLYFCCIESPLLPVGIFIMGWTARESIHWIVPCIGITMATIGIFSIYLATFNYLADCYGQYASSAIAAQSACRNFLGGSMPLYTLQMFKSMGYGFGGAASLLGSIGFLLTLVPWILAWKGKQIRARSKICSAQMQGEAF